MTANTLVFRDEEAMTPTIVERLQESPVRLALADVTCEEPGRPIAGESWRPTLAPYEPWAHDPSLDEADGLEGTDGDLLVVGALGMGISDEERQALIGDAVHGRADATEGAGAARQRTPHELWTSGLTPRWRPTGEVAGQGAEGEQGPSPAPRPSLADPPKERFATSVPVTVRRVEGGYALSAMHLTDLADRGLRTDGLVVAVPAFVEGLPVVRITSEAFARRFAGGVHVRLLVVPDTVEVVGARAFGALCVETVRLGAGVRSYDPAPLDLAVPSPRLERRRYEVDPANERFAASAGCLVEGGERLLFAEVPQAERLVVPEGVRTVGPAAFAKGAPMPRVIDVPASLQRVEGRVDPEVVWRGADAAALGRIVARCGGRATDLRAVEVDGCWYGLSDRVALAPCGLAPDGAAPAQGAREAHLVAGPPAPQTASRRFSAAAHARAKGEASAQPGEAPEGQPAASGAPAAEPLGPREAALRTSPAPAAPPRAADRLVLPREVDGAPLVAIAARALLTAPAALALPDTVRVVGEGNACQGTRRLVLPEGLRVIGAHCFCSRILEGPVDVPASVRSIGKGSFEYAVVRLVAAGAVVHVTSDQLMSCFLGDSEDGVPFDFVRYDQQLLAGRGLPDHLGALLHRLSGPFRLEPAMAERIAGALSERAAEAMARVAQEGSVELVRALAESGFLDERSAFDAQIERLRASNRADCVLFLMEWRHGREGAAPAAPQRARDRFAL